MFYQFGVADFLFVTTFSASCKARKVKAGIIEGIETAWSFLFLSLFFFNLEQLLYRDGFFSEIDVFFVLKQKIESNTTLDASTVHVLGAWRQGIHHAVFQVV